MRKAIAALALLAMAVSCTTGLTGGFRGSDDGNEKAVANEFRFNGYTNHWQNVYRTQYQYGNLYRVNVPDIEKMVAQSKRDLAASMGIAGLQMQEGFFNGLVNSEYAELCNPSAKELKAALRSSDNVLLLVDSDSDAAKELAEKNPHKPLPLTSYQTKAEGFSPVDAFILSKGRKNLYVVLGGCEDLAKLKGVIDGAKSVVADYDMKRGWFGTGTNIQSVTCQPGTPIDVMGQGMNEGNTWFVFSGGYETHSKDKIANWVAETGAPIVTDLGASPLYGCRTWDDFQSQLVGYTDSWHKLKERNGGYMFRRVGAPKGEVDRGTGEGYDGFFANVGHERQINESDEPFVLTTGNLLGGTTNSMVLFNRKGDSFDKAKMWEAIMDRRSVAVGENAVVMGDEIFRHSIQLMMLDREFIEEYFGDRVKMVAHIEGTKLHVALTNLYDRTVKGKFSVQLPAQIELGAAAPASVSIPAGETKEIVLDLNPKAEAMGRLSAVVVNYEWNNTAKSTMAKLDMPPAVSAHQLLYGSASGTKFPVSVYNFTNDEAVALKVDVVKKDNPSEVVYSESRDLNIAKSDYEVVNLDLKLAPGAYLVKSEAMGVTAETQLGIGEAKGSVTLREVDLNDDGVNEYIMENDKVRVTLLTTGARVIEYIVKAKNDNVFFKLWPDKPEDVNRPFRERAFWPFGGFEDFLGQASMETHKVYSAEIIRDGGEYAEVRMRGEYYGNVIEKTFTLYGDTPLLGIRFALDMINPELDVLGPQPILSLGKAHGPEDDFVIPEIGGIQKYQMNPRRMWGKILDLQEGWNAGHDRVENVSFVGAYPVDRPFYLHMWMNLDTNPDSHHPYVELQPWLPLYHNSTSYFSYYMWADGASWEKGLKELRDRNLITER